LTWLGARTRWLRLGTVVLVLPWHNPVLLIVTDTKAEEAFLEEGFTSIACDRRVARLAAVIRQRTTIKLPDAAIAATAMVTHTPLVTRNERDFRNVSGLTMVTI